MNTDPNPQQKQFKGDGYKAEQRETRRRLRMGYVIDEKRFFNRGASAAKQQRAERKRQRRNFLRAAKAKLGRRVNLHKGGDLSK